MDIAYDEETTTAHDDIKEQLFHTTVREQTVSELRLIEQNLSRIKLSPRKFVTPFLISSPDFPSPLHYAVLWLLRPDRSLQT